MFTNDSADVRRMLKLLQDRIQRILGDNLVGLYVTGSLVTGDFDEDVSDLDLLAVTATSLDQPALDALAAMHRALSVEEKRWDNRIEVAYLTTEALRTFKTRTSLIAITSPGEPFHTKPAGRDWLINWWVVREHGATLVGPSPRSLIDPISRAEVVRAVVESADWWRGRIPSIRQRNAQVYAVLTMCRALRTFRIGDYVSKRKAALWAEAEVPEWAPVIRRALESWRADWYRDDVDHEATLAEAVGFVSFVVEQIAAR